MLTTSAVHAEFSALFFFQDSLPCFRFGVSPKKLSIHQQQWLHDYQKF
jgi:hypothetical protein